MSDEKKTLKPIIKRASSNSSKYDHRQEPLAGTSSFGSVTDAHYYKSGSPLDVAVPTVISGRGKTHSGSSKGPFAASSTSVNVASIHSSDRLSAQHVHFSDHLSLRSISANLIASASDIGIGMGSNPDGDRAAEVPKQNFQDDPNYLPGFVDLYHSREITISETTCCCNIYTTYNIINENGRTVYAVEKETTGLFLPFLKFLCLRKHDLLRTGFIIRVYNNTTANNTKLLTFQRTAHWFADQLDIVETYYSRENAHVGRIEKAKDGFRLVDPRGRETYRVFRESKLEKARLKTKGTLIVFNCETRKVAAKISYVKRRFFGSLCSLFMDPLQHSIKWSTEIGVAMKAQLLGALFLELHSNEKFVDLPLGRDANISMNSTKHRLNIE